jgi:hypothetical protein
MMDRREALLLVQLLKGRDRTSPAYRDHQRDEDHDREGDGTALVKAPHLPPRTFAHAFQAPPLF